MKRVWVKRQLVPRYFKLTPATETLIFAVVIGILGGFGALLFKKLIFSLQDLLWATPDMAPDSLLGVAWYRRLLMPMLGGVIVGPLIYLFAREARGHGEPRFVTPDAAYAFREGDTILVSGATKDIEALKNNT